MFGSTFPLSTQASPCSINHPGLALNHLLPDKKCTGAVLQPFHICPPAIQGFGGFITAAVNMDRGGTFLEDLTKGRDYQKLKGAVC